MHKDRSINLIEEGHQLINKVKSTELQEISTIVLHIDKIFEHIIENYENWRTRVIEFLKTSKIDKLTISGAINSDTLLIDRPEWVESAQNKGTRSVAIRLYIENINKVLDLLNITFSLTPKITDDAYDKCKLKISKDEGIVRVDNHSSYPIKGKRLKIIETLKDEKSRSGEEIIRMYNPEKGNLNLLSGEITNINETLRRKIGVKVDIILSLETVGYKLNSNDFSFEFLI